MYCKGIPQKSFLVARKIQVRIRPTGDTSIKKTMAEVYPLGPWVKRQNVTFFCADTAPFPIRDLRFDIPYSLSLPCQAVQLLSFRHSYKSVRGKKRKEAPREGLSSPRSSSILARTGEEESAARGRSHGRRKKREHFGHRDRDRDRRWPCPSPRCWTSWRRSSCLCSSWFVKSARGRAS